MKKKNNVKLIIFIKGKREEKHMIYGRKWLTGISPDLTWIMNKLLSSLNINFNRRR